MNRIAVFLSFSLILLGSTAPLAQAQEGEAKPLFGAEFEFAGQGNRVAVWENQDFNRYKEIMRIVAEHYGGSASEIKKVSWEVPHPSREGETRTLFRAEWTDSRGKKWLLEPEYVATKGLDGYELVTPPMENAEELREVLEKVRGSGLVREGQKSGVHIHVDGKRLVTSNGNATGLINLINMHENYEPLLRRLFNPVRGGGYQNYFAQPLYVTHSEMLHEISQLPEAERTKEGIERVFRRHQAKEMRAHGITELDAAGWKKMWKYNNLNLKNIININEALPAEIGTVEFRMNDLSTAETHRLQIELYRRMVERAAELAAEGKTVKYERGPDFKVPEGVDPSRHLTSENPAEVKARIGEMIESLGLNVEEYKSLIEKNVRGSTIASEREVKERIEKLTRGEVKHNGKPVTFGFELEGRGEGIVSISRPTDAEVNARWDRMSLSDKKAYFRQVVGSNHDAAGTKFEIDTRRYPHMEAEIYVEGTGNWELRSKVFTEIGKAADAMREIKAKTGKSASGFHLHLRNEGFDWEAMRGEKGQRFADFIDRTGNWIWLQRVLRQRTDLSLKSWSNSRFTPKTLEAIAEGSPNNYERHTLRVGKNVMGGQNVDIEIRGLVLDVDRIETVAKVISENMRTGDWGRWKFSENVMPGGNYYDEVPKELRLEKAMAEYYKTAEGLKMSPELKTVVANLQTTYPELTGRDTRVLPLNLGAPLLPWEAETSLDEAQRRRMRYAREVYLADMLRIAQKVQAGGFGFDINVASQETLEKTLEIKGKDAQTVVEARRTMGELSSRGDVIVAVGEELGKNARTEGINFEEVKASKLVEKGFTEAEAKRFVRIRKALNAYQGEIAKLDYVEIERQSRLKVKKWATETELDRAIFRTLLPKAEAETRTQGFANRRRAPTTGSEFRISNSEVREVFEAMREAMAERSTNVEGRNAERVRNAQIEILRGNELVVDYNPETNKVRISEATLTEIYNRSKNLPPEQRVLFRRKAMGIFFGHELAHSSGIKSESKADIESVEALKKARNVGVIEGLRNPITKQDIKETLRVFEKPTGSKMVDNIIYRLRQLPRYGFKITREGNLNRAANGQADPLGKFRRADGTVNWAKAGGAGALGFAKGSAHFALALFLKELAVVVQTGDRARIDEFFDGLMTVGFFETYALFSAGAAGANVLYGKTLEKWIRPKFVSGILRTNIVLATGMALPEIYHGHFEGKAFAINVAALGLSTIAVKGAIGGIKWVYNLKTFDKARKVTSQIQKYRRFAKVGGWFYTAAETAVVLYFGDELAQAVNKFLDDRAARENIEKATKDFFDAVGNGKLSDEDFAKALVKFDGAHIDHRNYLFKKLNETDSIYFARMARAAEEAKNLADKRKVLADKLAKFKNLRDTVLRNPKYNTVEDYLNELAARDEAKVNKDVEMYMDSYNKSREEIIDEIYKGNKRSGAYLTDANTTWVAQGAKVGAGNDPLNGRTDWFANRSRQGAIDDVLDSARDISFNRLQAYDDQVKALEVARAASTDPERRALLDSLIVNVKGIKEKDTKLISVKSDGATSAIKGLFGGQGE